jgi:hypothetical protein
VRATSSKRGALPVLSRVKYPSKIHDLQQCGDDQLEAMGDHIRRRPAASVNEFAANNEQIHAIS